MARIFDVLRDGKTVFIRIQLASDTSEPHWFRRSFEDEPIASIVEDRIAELMSTQVESLVGRAYGQGWSDAKRKRRKKDGFTNCINDDGDVAW